MAEPGTGSGPLAGLRVVELAGIGPAPFATMLMADLGAEVLRIDRPGARVPRDGSDALGRGKSAITLDLKDPADRARLVGLTDAADVIVDSSRPGVVERLHIGPDDLMSSNPALVYARMTGWGQSGPKAESAGHDIGYLASTGLLHAIGTEETPQPPLALVGDFGGGALYLVIGVLAALHERTFSGRGQVVDAAIVDGAAHMGTLVYGMLAAGRWVDQRRSNLMDGGFPFYGVYETSDGRHLSIGPVEPKFWDEFVDLLAPETPLPDRADRSAWPELRAAIADTLSRRSLAEWTEVFAGSDACVEPVLSLTEALRDPHLSERGTFIDWEGRRLPAPAPRFSRTPTGHPGPSPTPGTIADLPAHWTRR